MKLTSTNPAKNYEVLGGVGVSTEKEIEGKVKRAQGAQEKWKSLGLEERVNILRPIIKEIDRQKGALALLQTQEMGMPIKYSLPEMESSIVFANWQLDNTPKYLAPEVTFEDAKVINKVFYEPIGVAAVIVPWNFPIPNALLGIIPNLLVGNTVVFKHSEECPLSGKAVEEIFAKSQLPEGVFSEVYGDGGIGDLLVHQDINLIWFTGSTKVGKYLCKVGAEKFIKVLLEMGGSSPGIIFEDADIDKLLESIFIARFYNSAQVCDCVKRLIVHESKVDEVVLKLKNLLQAKKIGDPEDKFTDFGPLVAKRQLELLQAQVQDAIQKGAQVIYKGKLPEKLKGAYFAPMLLSKISKDMRIWQEEVFGPVLPIVTFKTEEEAINLANDTKFGLGSYIFTEDKEKVARVASEIEAGMVNHNTAYGFAAYNPFGGCKESGMGRSNGKWGLHELTQIKLVAFEK